MKGLNHSIYEISVLYDFRLLQIEAVSSCAKLIDTKHSNVYMFVCHTYSTGDSFVSRLVGSCIY